MRNCPGRNTLQWPLQKSFESKCDLMKSSPSEMAGVLLTWLVSQTDDSGFIRKYKDGLLTIERLSP